ncbi:MAG TPA: discoidin domain-containing protein [Burkholderiaceae bacterium]|nr:discoidin domain-containing protein [Burkholderiaceae bacterium]
MIRRRGAPVAFAAFLALLVLAGPNASAAPAMHVLDDFSDVSAWRASASDDVSAKLRRDGDGSLCLDFDFGGVSGYAVLRRELALGLPQDYAFHVRVKGSGPRNDLQFKLLDASGDNVWWATLPAFVLPAQPTDLRFKRRHISFAWGPTQDRELRRTHTIEFVLAAGAGGRGSFCLQRLALEERAAEAAAGPPRVTASAVLGSNAAALALDGRADTGWRAPGGAQTLQIDFGAAREFNGVKLRWLRGERATDYDVDISDDGRRWSTLRRVRGGGGSLDALFLPESETRYLRLKLLRSRGARYALAEIELPDHRQWPTLNAALATLAAEAPRGHVPRAFLGEQNYWTLVAVDGGGARSALVSEDGAIEIGRGGFSVEPSVQLADGQRVTWADVQITQSLRDGYLPLPAVHWRHAAFELDVETCAYGSRDAPNVSARYTLRNLTDRELTLTLALAVRPWQVNPPQQFLSTPGGVSPINTLRWSEGLLQVGDRAALRATQEPQRVAAAALDAGIDLDALERAPLRAVLTDAQGMASASLSFPVVLPAHGASTVGWVAPLGAPTAPANLTQADLDARFDAVAQHWRERLNRTRLRVPAAAQPVVDTLRTSLAHILMSRDGPALRPGTRSYARTWVRDGAMMVAGLLELGESTAAREFVDWYAGYIFANGKVPCCVDARGSDPVAENDSHGEYLYAVAEVWRHTRDEAWLARHWRNVARVVTYMEGLRQSQRGPDKLAGVGSACPGLMPASISHEGYYDKPACSYWDNFWTLRGYKDAALIARALGHNLEAAHWERWCDEFAREMVASILGAAVRHGIDFIPGAADRGDFDPTSTTIALNPAQAQDLLPRAQLIATYERYWRESELRAQSNRTWKDYTPYELRNVGAFVRLGQSERAHALLRFFFQDQRPRGWNQWAEVVVAFERQPLFLGDMPHAWVSSDYIRAVIDLFAYERERDDALVLAAGAPLAWLEGEGIEIRDLSTRYGLLSYRLARSGGGWTLEVGPGLALKGGLRLIWPGDGPLPKATLDGRALAWVGRELRIPAAQATVMLSRPDA